MNPIKIRYQLRNVRWTLIVTQLACLEPQNMFQEMAFFFFKRIIRNIMYLKEMAFFFFFSSVS